MTGHGLAEVNERCISWLLIFLLARDDVLPLGGGRGSVEELLLKVPGSAPSISC